CLAFLLEQSSGWDSPSINHFLSADTIVPGYANPQNLNRYSYVRNNPLKYTDPSGHMLDDGCRTEGCGGGGSGSGNSGGGGGDYCSTHPNACGGNGSGGSGNSGSGGSLSGSGLSSTCSPGSYSPRCPGWHFYRITNIVCPAYLHCTAAQLQDYLYRFAYPGQDPNNPVRNDAKNWVFVGILPLGQIQTQVNGLMITNVTQPLHLMYDGQIERRAIQASDGSWSIVTTGMGNNVQIPFVPEGPSGLEYSQMTNVDFAPLNQDLGPGAFHDLDGAMLNYIVGHQ
ncbi:MAG TPA: RHS repeat-associated core domain-containing protein, partial [Anaerolineales bacterium]|nr:RHS repeat-associated core domain-containing protein [Anaerolineales bacterium]